MKLITFNKFSNSLHKANTVLAFAMNIIAMLWSIENQSALSFISAFFIIWLTYSWITQVSYDLVATKDTIELYLNKPVFDGGMFVTQSTLLATAITRQKRLFRFQPLVNSGKMLMLTSSGTWVVIMDGLTNKQVGNLKITIGNYFEQIDRRQISS